MARSIVVASIVVTAVLLLSAVEAQNTGLVSIVCNGAKIPSGSAFFSDLGNLLVDLEGNTAASGYNYKAQYSGGGLTAYGQAICNQGLSQSQCKSCLLTLGNEIWGLCGNAIGARVQLVDCYIRYEQYSFSLQEEPIQQDEYIKQYGQE